MVTEAVQNEGSSAAGLVLGACGNPVAQRPHGWYTHHSIGCILDRLATRVAAIRYFAARAPDAAAETCDYLLSAPNVTVHAWSGRRNTLSAVRRPLRLVREYRQMADACDALFFRGSAPLIWTAHWMARSRRLPVVHWIVGNPVAILRAQPRGYGKVMDTLGIGFAKLEQLLLRLSLRASGAFALVNGEELARVFPSSRTIPVVSTSIAEDDFLVREDTCRGAEIRLLFVGFIRPEKGLVYLLRALPMIRCDRTVGLTIVGSWGQFPSEYRRLKTLADALGIADRITWEGYVAYGPELFARMDRSDILVLPSLSEGTPRVLVEARARCLPLIATAAGGIPSSVTHDVDGLLVPPADAAALAEAVSRLVRDEALRRRMIIAGRKRVAGWTVDRFVDLIVGLLTARGSRSCAPAGV